MHPSIYTDTVDPAGLHGGPIGSGGFSRGPPGSRMDSLGIPRELFPSDFPRHPAGNPARFPTIIPMGLHGISRGSYHENSRGLAWESNTRILVRTSEYNFLKGIISWNLNDSRLFPRGPVCSHLSTREFPRVPA